MNSNIEHSPGKEQDLSMNRTGKELDILALVCNWCTYTAADLAGVTRLQYPAQVRLIRFMCTGMIDVRYILRCFLDGADGVFIGGCHPGDCHYLSGNLKARVRIKGLLPVLETIGIPRERLRLEWIGASEGKKLQEDLTGFTEDIRKLGPLPFKGMNLL